MYNPNTLEQLVAAIVDDLQFLGLIIAERRDLGDRIYFEVGNESITLVQVRVWKERTEITAPHMNRRCFATYKGELERFSQEVAQKVVKMALVKREAIGI